MRGLEISYLDTRNEPCNTLRDRYRSNKYCEREGSTQNPDPPCEVQLDDHGNETSHHGQIDWINIWIRQKAQLSPTLREPMDYVGARQRCLHAFQEVKRVDYQEVE